MTVELTSAAKNLLEQLADGCEQAKAHSYYTDGAYTYYLLDRMVLDTASLNDHADYILSYHSSIDEYLDADHMDESQALDHLCERVKVMASEHDDPAETVRKLADLDVNIMDSRSILSYSFKFVGAAV